jgi:DNA helicase-2/ATP-dependent DNA helicase PcrA
MLKKGDSDEYQDRISNIKEFKSVLKETELDHEDEGLTNEEILDILLSDLALRSENDDAKESDSVILTTYHQAKGLEFKNVFMVAMEDGIFPSQNSVTKEDVEEERRICYVGITRAKDRLFISHVGRRFLFGFTQQMMPSCFLGEMKREFYNLYGEYKTPKKDIESKAIPNVLSAKDAVTSDLKVGDKVNHKTFGDGKVISINGKIAEIAFALPTGIKKMLSTHPSLTKIN